MYPALLLLAACASFAVSDAVCSDALASSQAASTELLENSQTDDVIAAPQLVHGFRRHRRSFTFRLFSPGLISVAVASALIIMIVRCYKTRGSGLRSKARRLATGGGSDSEQDPCKRGQKSLSEKLKEKEKERLAKNEKKKLKKKLKKMRKRVKTLHKELEKKKNEPQDVLKEIEIMTIDLGSIHLETEILTEAGADMTDIAEATAEVGANIRALGLQARAEVPETKF